MAQCRTQAIISFCDYFERQTMTQRKQGLFDFRPLRTASLIRKVVASGESHGSVWPQCACSSFGLKAILTPRICSLRFFAHSITYRQIEPIETEMDPPKAHALAQN